MGEVGGGAKSTIFAKKSAILLQKGPFWAVFGPPRTQNPLLSPQNSFLMMCEHILCILRGGGGAKSKIFAEKRDILLQVLLFEICKEEQERAFFHIFKGALFNP